MNEDQRRLRDPRVELSNLESRLTDAYPDVIKTREEIRNLEKQLEQKNGAAPGNETADNPAYITLAAQLASTQADIQSVRRQIDELKTRASDYRGRIEDTPKVEESYKALLVERNNTQAKHDDLMQKYMEARVAHGLEMEHKGERFTLIDPARLPEKPYKPNRIAIVLIGLVLGAGAGVAVASLREVFDNSVRSPESLTLATQIPVLAGIPEIRTGRDIRHKRRWNAIKLSALLVAVACAVAAVHFWVMDLNIFWAKLMRRLSL
jgi:uncharacterized protein involved in exopolysaccharide biosynthesis